MQAVSKINALDVVLVVSSDALKGWVAFESYGYMVAFHIEAKRLSRLLHESCEYTVVQMSAQESLMLAFKSCGSVVAPVVE
jgi:hypothetical protein